MSSVTIKFKPLSGEDKDNKTMDNFLQTLPAKNLAPLWPEMNALVPPNPNPTAKPAMWKYQEVLPHLQMAGALVPEQDAERRVLMLVNPSMKPPHTTDTIYGGLQVVNPGETAPAHRHVAYACRFIIEGEGFTAVEGKKMPLVRGDAILTPPWHWHDHGNESNAPVLWLDMLNLPLFTYAPVHFAQGYAEKRYPSVPCDPCEWRFPWEPVQGYLDSQQTEHSIYHYKRQDGNPLSTTLGLQAERLSPGTSSRFSRDSSSFIYHVVEGKGRTIIETPSNDEVVFLWDSKDTFAVPAWSRIQHINESAMGPAYLLAVNDAPFLDLLQLRRP